jgi:hypothetical protein
MLRDMADRERERGLLAAKIAGLERRQADLKSEPAGAGRSAAQAANDLDLMMLRRKLRELDGS